MSGETLLLSGSSLAVGRDSGNNQNDESSTAVALSIGLTTSANGAEFEWWQ